MPGLPAPQQNHLLAALSVEAQNRLFPHLELVSLPLGKVLYESGDSLRHVYFPTNAIVSLLYVMESRGGPHFLDRFLRSYFPTYQPAPCSLTDS